MNLKKWVKRQLKETSITFRSIPSLVVTMFIVAVIAMNLLANKSIDLPFSWLALDCGIIVSWLIFLMMDIVTKSFGVKVGNRLAIMGLIINLFMCLVFLIASLISGTWGLAFLDDGTISGEINNAINSTFKNTWFVILGSSIAFIASSLINNYLNYGIGKSVKKNPNGFGAFAVRAYISTFIGQLADNLIFALIVSHNFFGWSLLQCFTCAVCGAVVELVCEVIFSPIGYKISKKWEREGIIQNYTNQMNELTIQDN